MVLKLDIPPELEHKLLERASVTGEDVAEYVRRVIERNLTTPSLDEVLAPFRAEVDRSGVTDEELDAIVEEAREQRFQDLLRQRDDQDRKSA